MTQAGGCLSNFLTAFIAALSSVFMGFSVNLAPPHIYTLSVDASAEELIIIEEVLDLRLEMLLNNGQINAYEPLVTTPDGEIIVTLTMGKMSEDDVLKTLTTTGRLEFVDLSTLPTTTIADNVPINTLFSGEIPAILTNTDVAAVTVVEDAIGGFAIQVDFTSDAAEILGSFTEAHIGQRLAIVIDGMVISAPIIQQRFDSSAWISGNFTEDEAQSIASQVGTMPLPLPLNVITVDSG